MRGDPEAHRGRYESRVDEQIRKAMEAGKFDDLPGTGKPLRLPAQHDENWWIRSKLHLEGVSTDALLPPSLRLRKEIEGLDAAVGTLRDEDAVREVVADLDRRVVDHLRAPSGPAVPIRRPSADDVVARWQQTRVPARPARPPQAPEAPERRRSWWRRLRGGA